MQNNKKVKKRPLDLDADVFPVQKRMLKNPFSEQPLEPPPVFQACAVIQNLRSAKKLELFCAGILNLITIIVLLGHFHQKCTKQDVFVLKRVIHEHCQCQTHLNTSFSRPPLPFQCFASLTLGCYKDFRR